MQLSFICGIENELNLHKADKALLCFEAFIKPTCATFGSGISSVLLQCGADEKILSMLVIYNSLPFSLSSFLGTLDL